MKYVWWHDDSSPLGVVLCVGGRGQRGVRRRGRRVTTPGVRVGVGDHPVLCDPGIDATLVPSLPSITAHCHCLLSVMWCQYPGGDHWPVLVTLEALVWSPETDWDHSETWSGPGRAVDPVAGTRISSSYRPGPLASLSKCWDETQIPCLQTVHLTGGGKVIMAHSVQIWGPEDGLDNICLWLRWGQSQRMGQYPWQADWLSDDCFNN